MTKWIYTFSSINQTSDYLKCTNFGFTIPSGAIITGLFLQVYCIGNGKGQIQEASVRLIDSGIIKAETEMLLNPINLISSKSQTILTYGSASSLWSYPLTSTNMNNNAFGIALTFKSTDYFWNGSGDKPYIKVNNVSLTVYYSSGSNTQTTTVQENVLYGCKTSGKIYTLSEYALMDYQDPILFVKRSGMLTYNTLKNKRVDRLHLRLRRGVKTENLPNNTATIPSVNTVSNSGTTVTANLYLTWVNNYATNIFPDNEITNFDNYNITTIPINTTESFSEVCLYRLGVYRIRQYQLIMFDPVPFTLIEMEEEVTSLRD